MQQSCLAYYKLAAKAKFTCPNKVHEMVNNTLPNPQKTMIIVRLTKFTSFRKKNQNKNQLQIAAAIARSPAVSASANPLTKLKNTACCIKAGQGNKIQSIRI